MTMQKCTIHMMVEYDNVEFEMDADPEWNREELHDAAYKWFRNELCIDVDEIEWEDENE